MKKLLIVILSVIASACLCVGFVGCNNTSSNGWTFDATYHWHKDEISQKEAHKYYGNKCYYCGYDVSDKADMFAEIDAEKIINDLFDNAYTISATKDDDTIRVALSAKDLFVKITAEDTKVLADLSGVYIKSEEELSCFSIKAIIDRLLYSNTGMPLDAFVERINAYLSEEWTLDDFISIVWNGEKFEFNTEKAIALIEDAFFNDDITIWHVILMSLDGFTYEDITTIFKPTIIEAVNNALPEGWTLERIMPMFVNLTPANLQALYDAFCAGELTVDVINALLPNDLTIDMLKIYFPDADFNEIIETVNSVVKFINSIDFEEVERQIKEAYKSFVNATVDTLFLKEIVDGNVKYILNYGLIKDANKYFNETTLETIINSVLGEGFVDDAAAYGVFLLDSKLSDLKTMLEGYIGITLEEVLDYIDEYAPKIAPIINQKINEMSDEPDDEEYFDVLPYIQGATLMVRAYLQDANFMDKTLGETITMFGGGKGMTVETIKGYIATAVEFLKTKTVYDALLEYDVIEDKEVMYDKINAFADMLIENYPVYFVINAAGGLEEISATLVDEKMSILIQKGDKIGDVFTEEENTELVGAKTKYTVADFKGYTYVDYNEYGDSSGNTHRVDIVIKVEVSENGGGTYVISREYKQEYDIGRYETEKHSYYFSDADLSDAMIAIEDGTVSYTVICYDYTMIDDNGSVYGYQGYTTITLVFGEDETWLEVDDDFVEAFFTPIEEEPEVV